MKNLHTLDSYRLTEKERELYGIKGDEGFGVFKVYVDGKSFFVIASDGGGWEHVSVSPCNKKRKVCPTWEEMCAIKDMFFDPEERVVQFHPSRSEYVNDHPYVRVRLYQPIQGQENTFYARRFRVDIEISTISGGGGEIMSLDGNLNAQSDAEIGEFNTQTRSFTPKTEITA